MESKLEGRKLNQYKKLTLPAMTGAGNSSTKQILQTVEDLSTACNHHNPEIIHQVSASTDELLQTEMPCLQMPTVFHCICLHTQAALK